MKFQPAPYPAKIHSVSLAEDSRVAFLAVWPGTDTVQAPRAQVSNRLLENFPNAEQLVRALPSIEQIERELAGDDATMDEDPR